MILGLLIILVVIFTGIYFLMRFLYSYALNAAQARLNNLHEENLVKEQQLTEELKRAKAEGDAEIKRARDEAGLIIEEARNEAVKLRLHLEEAARAEADKIVAGGNIEVQRAKEKHLQEAEAHSLDLAAELLAQLLGENTQAALQQEFISEVIAEIAKLPNDQFGTVSDRVKVSTAQALKEEQKDKLQQVLKEKTGRQVAFEESLKKELIGGLIIEIGGLVIDGSLKNKLQRILPHFRKK